jgi:RNA polymerase sigma factor (sigma-70 family)
VSRGSSDVAEATPIVAEPEADDHRLVAAVRRGDDRAFEALYSRYQRRIHAYAMGMVKDHGRAEDVTQEVFVSALRRMRETERPIAFKPWIYEIAKNACIDQFRRSRRAEEVSLEADEGLAPADYGRLVGSDPAPHDAVETKQDLNDLCGAFGGLSDAHHEILLLRELEGLSYREIGDRMGMSRPAVESTLFRARRRLTEEYDELVTGARCQRVQSLIAMAVETRLGTREERRLSRHLSHCQPCRREAMLAGLDDTILAHIPLRRRAAAKIAALFPFGFLGRPRGGGADSATGSLATASSGRWMAHVPMLSDQLSGGWGKLAATAAVLVAGVGAAGVGSQVAGGNDAPAGDKPAQQRTVAAQSAGAAAKPVAAENGAPGKARRVADRRATQRKAAQRRAGEGTAGGESTPAGGTPTAGADPGANGAKGGSSSPKLPDVTLPTNGTDPAGPIKKVADKVVKPVVEGVNKTVEDVTAPVNQVIDDTNQVVDDTTGAVEDATGVPVPPLPSLPQLP